MKGQRWRKISGVMLTALLGMTLIGCGQKAGNTTAQKEYVYVPEYQSIELDDGMDYVVVVGDTVYFRTGLYNEQSGHYENQLGTFLIGEKTPKLTTLDLGENANASGMNVDAAGNVQMLVTTYVYEEEVPLEDEVMETDEAEKLQEEGGEDTSEETEEAVEDTVEETEEAVDMVSESIVIVDAGSAAEATMVEWMADDSVPMADSGYVPYELKREIRTYNSDGVNISNIDLTDALQREGEVYLEYLETDKDGNLYLGGEQSVWVFDKNGSQVCKLELDSWLSNMFSTKDGQVMVAYYGEQGTEVHPIDLQARKIDTSDNFMPNETYGNYTFVKGTDTDLLYTVDDNLYTYNFGEETPTKVLNWIDCDIDADTLRTFSLLEDGRILAITSTWKEGGKSEAELVYLTKKKGSEVPEKKILVLGTMSVDYNVRKQVIEFNKTNPEYRIEIKDYLNDISTDGYEAAMEQMNTDIVSGSCPDLIDLSGANMQQYIAKGILADLYPLIDADEEIHREDFLDNIMHAYETDGKLYALPPRFCINTVIGKRVYFGDRKSITLGELMDITRDMPEDMELYEYATKDSIIMWNTMMNMGQYVNWSTGECKFNSDDFVKVLEFANSFEREYNFEGEQISTPTKIREDKVLMINSSISSMQEYQMFRDMFSEAMTFVGYPTTKDNGSFISNGGTLLALSAKSPYQEGAWQFLRKNYTKEEQEKTEGGMSYGFPIMKSALEQKFAKDMEDEYYEDAEGNKHKRPKTTWGYDDFSVEIYAATEQDVAMVRDLIDTLDTVYQYDEKINQIIMEESAPYFEGQKSAKEVADIIQSRVQIYVNENR